MRAEMRASADAAIKEAQITVSRELENVRTEVQKRVDTEFKSENIIALVRDVAKGKTEKELEGIIRSETSGHVKRGIEAQGPVIKKTVEEETRKAVDALQPSIATAVTKATEDRVKQAVVPIEKQMSGYGEMIRVGTLATLARSDDRQAFDSLYQIALGKTPESANPQIRKLADSTVASVMAETKFGVRVSPRFIEKQTPENLKKYMLSRNSSEREAAVAHYTDDDRSILPVLIQLIQKDGSLSVVHAAVNRFNKLTQQNFNFWDTTALLGWWEKNRHSYQ